MRPAGQLPIDPHGPPTPPSVWPSHGTLHCSVIDSDDAEAFARNGNSFGRNIGGQHLLSYRDFGTYEIAPPPESIWAAEEDDASAGMDEYEVDDFFDLGFEEEEEQENLGKDPMMPWYEQVDAW